MRRRNRPLPVVQLLEPRALLIAYFVSPGGSDTAAGTSAAPWKTLQKAANSVAAGDVVTVRAGTYSSGFHLTRDGTAAARITFQAEPGVVVTGRNATTADAINLEGADYITIDGFTIDNRATAAITRAGIRSVTNTNAIIRNNTIHQPGRWGIFSGFSENILIENNEANRAGLEHGVYVSNSADNPVIRNNRLWGNRACGIHMNGDASEGGDGVISNALVEGNTIYGNGVGGGSGINGDGLQNSIIRNNLIYDNHASGISLYRIDGGDGAKNNTVVNNTIVMAADGRWAINIQNASSGNTVFNNILYHLGARGAMDVSPDSRPGLASDYNAVIDRFVTGGGNLTLAQWRSTSGQDQHSFVATPAQLFVNPSANDYHLRDGAPAVDAGVGSLNGKSAPAVDIDNQSRPSGAAYDIGADERLVAATFATLSPDGTLSITGTASADVVSVSAANNVVTATLNGQSLTFPAGQVQRVAISTLAGNDATTLGQGIAQLSLAGGAGADTLTTASSATLTLTGDNLSLAASGTSSLTLNGFARLGGLSLSNTSVLNLNNNDLVTAYAGASSIDQFRQHILAGRIIASAGRRVAPIDNAMIRQATWLGQPISDGVSFTQLIFKSALPGDANLDGQVTTADYAPVIANMGRTTAHWLLGDLNADGVVSTSDFAQVTQNLSNTATSTSSAKRLPLLKPRPLTLRPLPRLMRL